MRDPKAVLAEIAAAEAPDAYSRSLHPKHEQFARLREALLKARGGGSEEEEKPAADGKDIKRILINMERWRWMPEELGSIYVLHNSAEFMLYVVKDNKTIYADKTLVGTIGYATPIFTSPMTTIVFNPGLERARNGGEGEHPAGVAEQEIFDPQNSQALCQL